MLIFAEIYESGVDFVCNEDVSTLLSLKVHLRRPPESSGERISCAFDRATVQPETKPRAHHGDHVRDISGQDWWHILSVLRSRRFS